MASGTGGYEQLQAIRVEVSDGVAWATIDYPPMNLWGGGLGAELYGLIHAVEGDADVRVLVLATSRASCSNSGNARSS